VKPATAREATKSLEDARSWSPVRAPFTPTIGISVFCYHKKSRPDGKRVGQSISPRNFKVIYRPGEKNTKKKMCYLGVGTTALKRGVKPPQSAFSRLFRGPSGSDEKRRRRPSDFDGQDCRDSEGVFEDTADGIVVLSLMFKLPAAAGRHSHASAPMQTCGWC
jgi:hypothetical protein